METPSGKYGVCLRFWNELYGGPLRFVKRNRYILPTQCPKRADAARNYDKLLAAAREAFTSQGEDASLEGIARRADVGIGTLYRNFRRARRSSRPSTSRRSRGSAAPRRSSTTCISGRR